MGHVKVSAVCVFAWKRQPHTPVHLKRARLSVQVGAVNRRHFCQGWNKCRSAN
jgi:hypothetical protein